MSYYKINLSLTHCCVTKITLHIYILCEVIPQHFIWKIVLFSNLREFSLETILSNISLTEGIINFIQIQFNLNVTNSSVTKIISHINTLVKVILFVLLTLLTRVLNSIYNFVFYRYYNQLHM